jgi:hypothetical protein
VLLLPDNLFNKLTIRIAIPDIWCQEGLSDFIIISLEQFQHYYLFQLYVTLHFCISVDLKKHNDEEKMLTSTSIFHDSPYLCYG